MGAPGYLAVAAVAFVDVTVNVGIRPVLLVIRVVVSRNA
jgi:hypothetical protein